MFDEKSGGEKPDDIDVCNIPDVPCFCRVNYCTHDVLDDHGIFYVYYVLDFTVRACISPRL
jgi:hypothetical protein